jgi:membrane fusion protein (multidrug efflux system)
MTKSFLTGKYFFKVIIINQKTMKQKLIQAVLFGSCMAFAVSCGQAPTARGEAEYSVMTISTSDVTIPSTHSATIRGRQDIAIYPQVSGTISKVCVKEGEVVRQGQLLFIIDQVPYKAALQTAKANVAAAEASVATAQLTYDSKKSCSPRTSFRSSTCKLPRTTC